MEIFPSPIPKAKEGDIPLYTDIGVDLLLDEICKFNSKSIIENEVLSHEAIRDVLDSWFLGLEIDPSVVAERQAIMGYVLQDDDFTNAVDKLAIRPYPRTHDEMHLYSAMLLRFETFAEGISYIVHALRGKEKPKTLANILKSCEQVQEEIEEAQGHLNPEFEVRVEAEGESHKGLLSDIFIPNTLKTKYKFVYVLVNKDNNSVKRGSNREDFGVEPTWLGRRDSFLQGLEEAIEYSLKSTLGIFRRPLFGCDYEVSGIAKYNGLST